MGQRKKGASSEVSDAPAVDEFMAMRRIHIHLMQWQGKQIEWKEGDNVFIRSPKDSKKKGKVPDLELWRAKIAEIRSTSHEDSAADDNSDNVWALVMWYYSPAMFKTALGHNTVLDGVAKENELLLMHDHTQVLSVLTFEDHAEVFKYAENDIKQTYIPHDTIFFRVSWRMQTQSCLSGRLKECGCKSCKKTYRPEESIWCYCQMNGCRKWFDSRCLKARNGSMGPEQLAESYQSSFTPEDELLVPEVNIPPKMVHPKKPRTGTIDDYIPDDLLALARRPIMRGREYGVVGVALPILRARVLVEAALKGRCPSQSWETVVWVESGPKTLPPYVPPRTRRGKAVYFACPFCGSPI